MPEIILDLKLQPAKMRYDEELEQDQYHAELQLLDRLLSPQDASPTKHSQR